MDLSRKELSIVDTLAHIHASKMPMLEYDDIWQQGAVGLIKAKKMHKPETGAKFITYAWIKISGEIINMARRNDRLSKETRFVYKAMMSARDKLAGELLREPTNRELAEYCDMPLDEVFSLMEAAYRCADITDKPSDENHLSDPLDPYATMAYDETVQELVFGIDNLPERTKYLFNEFFNEGRKLKDIGKDLGITESGACALKQDAIAKLKIKEIGS